MALPLAVASGFRAARFLLLLSAWRAISCGHAGAARSAALATPVAAGAALATSRLVALALLGALFATWVVATATTAIITTRLLRLMTTRLRLAPRLGLCAALLVHVGIRRQLGELGVISTVLAGDFLARHALDIAQQ